MPGLIDLARGRRARLTASLALAALSAACATARPPAQHAAGTQAAPYKVGKPYQVRGVWYTPKEDPRYDETGVGSWYGEQFHNRHTANGEVFDMDLVSAAHKTLPLPSLVEVTNLDNGRKMVVRVNDRGPFIDGRIIDLSRAAARELGYENKGVARVRVRYVGPAPQQGMGARTYRAGLPPAQIPKKPGPYKALATAGPIGVAPAPRPLAGGPEYLPDIRPARRGEVTTSTAYRVQAGAFADRRRAEIAVKILSREGRAEIVPLQRDGMTLYRVQVSGQGEPYLARDRVAALGYVDARLVEDF